MKPYLLHRRNLIQLGCFDSLNQLFGFDSLHQICWLGRHCSPWFQPRRRLVPHCKLWQKEPGGTDIPATRHTALQTRSDLCIPRKETARPRSQFLHSCIPVRFIFFHDWTTHRLNMKVDLQSLLGLHVTWCAKLYSLAETPQLPPSPRIWTRISRALLVSKGRRHLFVTSWAHQFCCSVAQELLSAPACCKQARVWFPFPLATLPSAQRVIFIAQMQKKLHLQVDTQLINNAE